MRNWSKTLTFNSSEIKHPSNLQEFKEIALDRSLLKAVGTRHSFSSIADTDGTHMTPDKFQESMELNPEDKTVTVSAGVRYGELGEFLARRGSALHNLASLPHISVVGACATATHGSGDGNSNLGSAVRAIELVTAQGTVERFSAIDNQSVFQGMVAHLGALGFVSKITLAVEPAFEISQRVYEGLSFSQLDKHFDAITGAAYSVSFFTRWLSHTIDQVWLKERDNHHIERPEFFGAIQAQAKLHPIKELDSTPCTEQLGIPGSWHDRLSHFRLSHTPSSGDEIQTEYFFSRTNALEAMRRLFELGSEIAPVLLISEIRTVAADEQWLSPCYKSGRVGIHFTWKSDHAGVERLLPIIERELADLEPIPHWAKVFRLSPEIVRSRYARLSDFQKLAKELDPQGKFKNEFLNRYVL